MAALTQTPTLTPRHGTPSSESSQMQFAEHGLPALAVVMHHSKKVALRAREERKKNQKLQPQQRAKNRRVKSRKAKVAAPPRLKQNLPKKKRKLMLKISHASCI